MKHDETKVLLLVGGFGTRLRSVLPATPKPLASVGDRSFLELLILQLRNQGFRKLVMCSGYLAEQIEKEFGDGSSFGVSIEYSVETTPLGTGGAVKFAASHYVQSGAVFLVMNGDSFVDLDLNGFMAFHRSQAFMVSMAVRPVVDASRYGTVEVGENCRVTRFSEKAGVSTPGLVNAGVYAFNYSILERIPDGRVSLELEAFPEMLDDGISAFETDGLFIDIGTPEDYSRAQAIFEKLLRSATGSPESSRLPPAQIKR